MARHIRADGSSSLGMGYGPHIPTIPAIVLAKKIATGAALAAGAYACVGKVSLGEYLSELKEYPVTTTSF